MSGRDGPSQLNGGGQKSELRSDDAIVRQEGEHRDSSIWNSLVTFYRAPCLQPSLGMGAAGGTAIGLLRFISGSGGAVAFTWGSTVAGLLAGTSWFTCRRALYQKAMTEVALLERVQQGDPDALLQYQELLEARQAQMEAAGVLKEK